MPFKAQNSAHFSGNSFACGAFSEKRVTESTPGNLPSPLKLFFGEADFQARQENFLIRRSFFSERRVSLGLRKSSFASATFFGRTLFEPLQKKLRKPRKISWAGRFRPSLEKSFGASVTFPRGAQRGPFREEASPAPKVSGKSALNRPLRPSGDARYRLGGGE